MLSIPVKSDPSPKNFAPVMFPEAVIVPEDDNTAPETVPEEVEMFPEVVEMFPEVVVMFPEVVAVKEAPVMFPEAVIVPEEDRALPETVPDAVKFAKPNVDVDGTYVN